MTKEIKAPKLPMQWSSGSKDDKNSPRLYIQNQVDELVLPISGGWGYSVDDCVVIDKDDASVDTSLPFKGVPIEYQFIEKRIYAELIVFKSEADRSSGIQWELLSQMCEAIDGKTYDILDFKVTAYKDNDWNYLKKDWADNEGFKNNPSGLNNHTEERDKRMYFYNAQFWFDITSFHDGATEGENKTLGSYTPEEKGTKYPRR